MHRYTLPAKSFIDVCFGGYVQNTLALGRCGLCLKPQLSHQRCHLSATAEGYNTKSPAAEMGSLVKPWYHRQLGNLEASSNGFETPFPGQICTIHLNGPFGEHSLCARTPTQMQHAHVHNASCEHTWAPITRRLRDWTR